jgi:hypothetical protein
MIKPLALAIAPFFLFGVAASAQQPTLSDQQRVEAITDAYGLGCAVQDRDIDRKRLGIGSDGYDGSVGRQNLARRCDSFCGLFLRCRTTGSYKWRLQLRRGAQMATTIMAHSTLKNSKAVNKASAKNFVVCVDNDGYPAALETRKIYVVLRDALAEKRGLLRVIDESGEDYLYPAVLFREIALPDLVKKAVLAA